MIGAAASLFMWGAGAIALASIGHTLRGAVLAWRALHDEGDSL